MLVCSCVLVGCFQWTEDQNGGLRSVGVPGLPLWESKKPPAPMTPADLGMSPEEAAKVSGPVLVRPPIPPARAYRYQYYQTGQNHCLDDLKKLLAQRAQNNETGPEPYCSDNPSAPPVQGKGFIL